MEVAQKSNITTTATPTSYVYDYIVIYPIIVCSLNIRAQEQSCTGFAPHAPIETCRG
jgi:hypothetical protein